MLYPLSYRRIRPARERQITTAFVQCLGEPLTIKIKFGFR
jgi:hypothetical protein